MKRLFWVTLITVALAFAIPRLTQRRTPSPSQKGMEDSYAIYSLLLQSNVIEWSDVPRSLWLLEDTTKAIMSYRPEPDRHIPRELQAGFDEVLADYDAHFHDQYHLDGSKFRLELPVRLLDEEASKRYASGVTGIYPPDDNIMQAPRTPDEFKGAAGLHSFSAIYFNRAHTLAWTAIGMYCGSSCGNWGWAVLEKKNGEWKILLSAAPISS